MCLISFFLKQLLKKKKVEFKNPPQTYKFYTLLIGPQIYQLTFREPPRAPFDNCVAILRVLLVLFSKHHNCIQQRSPPAEVPFSVSSPPLHLIYRSELRSNGFLRARSRFIAFTEALFPICLHPFKRPFEVCHNYGARLRTLARRRGQAQDRGGVESMRPRWKIIRRGQ